MRKKVPPPEELSSAEKKKTARWFKKRWPGKPVKRLTLMWDDCRSYYMIEKRLHFEEVWRDVFVRWVIRAMSPKEKYREPDRGSAERPQQLRTESSSDLTGMRSFLRSIKGGKKD